MATDLQKAIEALVSKLASDIVDAVRTARLGELGLQRPSTFTTPVSKPRVVRAPKAAKVVAKKSTKRSAAQLAFGLGAESDPRGVASNDVTVDARVEVLPFVLGVAERFFVERAAKGATAPQLGDALKAQGIATDAKAVTQVLLDRGVIKDAGFRRTTGKGTSPVFAVAS